ncbi:MAG: molybdate ABC transporter substrate-binding protein [Paraperlucidibaca sp.]
MSTSLCALALPMRATADSLTVAVAANFAPTLRLLAERFELDGKHQVRVVTGSSGLLAAQIGHGAPYDQFYSADASKPQALIDAGLAQTSERYTYAIGRLVLWSAQAHRVDAQGRVLQTDFRYLALANPRLAPYGQAALDVLSARQLVAATRTRWVMGENIAQTYQFVATGNADLGFIALAQWQAEAKTGSSWLVPSALHRPIVQDALLLRATPASRAFWQFMREPWAREQIRRAGYDVPELSP